MAKGHKFEAFNKYFSGVAVNIHEYIKENGVKDKTKYMNYMTKAFESPFPSMKSTKTTSREIERIIGSFKSSQTQGYDEISNNNTQSMQNLY
jgi:hypothetical protein